MLADLIASGNGLSGMLKIEHVALLQQVKPASWTPLSWPAEHGLCQLKAQEWLGMRRLCFST